MSIPIQRPQKDPPAPRGYKRGTCCSCGRRGKVLVREGREPHEPQMLTIRCGHCDRVESKFAEHGYWHWCYLGHDRAECRRLAEEHGYAADEYGCWR